MVTKKEFDCRDDLVGVNKGRLGMNKGNKRPDITERWKRIREDRLHLQIGTTVNAT